MNYTIEELLKKEQEMDKNLEKKSTAPKNQFLIRTPTRQEAEIFTAVSIEGILANLILHKRKTEKIQKFLADDDLIRFFETETLGVTERFKKHAKFFKMVQILFAQLESYNIEIYRATHAILANLIRVRDKDKNSIEFKLLKSDSIEKVLDSLDMYDEITEKENQENEKNEDKDNVIEFEETKTPFKYLIEILRGFMINCSAENLLPHEIELVGELGDILKKFVVAQETSDTLRYKEKIKKLKQNFI